MDINVEDFIVDDDHTAVSPNHGQVSVAKQHQHISTLLS
jgi:hypothetical protein